jgi:hypothetical protein
MIKPFKFEAMEVPFFLDAPRFRNSIAFVERTPEFAPSSVAITFEDEEEYGALVE